MRLASFPVALDFAGPEVVSVDYSTSDGTAEAGLDYQATAGRLSFLPGQTQRTIQVPVLGDALLEADETFRVDLLDPIGASLADAVATGTILDDDVGSLTLEVTVAGSGSVTLAPPGGVYPAGTRVTLTALPAPGWEFAGWSGDLGGAQNPATLVLHGDRSVEAAFLPLPPPNQAPSGSILEPPGPVSVEVGQPLQFSGSGTDPDGHLPLAYLWTFDDSGLAAFSSEDPGALAFPAAGTFSVASRSRTPSAWRIRRPPRSR